MLFENHEEDVVCVAHLNNFPCAVLCRAGVGSVEIF